MAVNYRGKKFYNIGPRLIHIRLILAGKASNLTFEWSPSITDFDSFMVHGPRVESYIMSFNMVLWWFFITLLNNELETWVRYSLDSLEKISQESWMTQHFSFLLKIVLCSKQFFRNVHATDINEGITNKNVFLMIEKNKGEAR